MKLLFINYYLPSTFYLDVSELTGNFIAKINLIIDKLLLQHFKILFDRKKYIFRENAPIFVKKLCMEILNIHLKLI